MGRKTKNERCPLQKECGRTCEHVGAELKCDYYKNNGIGDNTIPDQEELRQKLESLREIEVFERENSELPDETDTKTLVYIPISELHPHPDNPRKDLGDLTELADSIKAKGVMQNLTVVPREEGGYTVIIGHRRMGASKLAGLTELPCVIVEMSPKDQIATMLLENMQRSDLTVFEQAAAFQMMFDFGESVESIAEKTGFSKSTVRRRLKMGELDQDTLKEVSGRQLSMEDFDRLSQIDDICQRNECLKQIGTANFNQTIEYRLKKQNIAKKLPYVKEFIKKHHANKIKWSETYGGKYNTLQSNIYFYDWDPETPLIVLDEKDQRKLYYCLDEDYGKIGFYVEAPKARPKTRPQAEIDREKYIADTRAQLTELSAIAHKLRRSFVSKINITSKNIADVLVGSVIANAMHVVSYVNTNSSNVYTKLGINENEPYDNRIRLVTEKIKKCELNILPHIIYAGFGDNENNSYWGGYTYDFPSHKATPQLDSLYDWLISLGYEMSDEERQLREGTHPLFVDKDKPQSNE